MIYLLLFALLFPGTAFFSEAAPEITDEEYNSLINSVDLDEIDLNSDELLSAMPSAEEMNRQELNEIKEANRILIPICNLNIAKLLFPPPNEPNQEKIRQKVSKQLENTEAIDQETYRRYMEKWAEYESKKEQHKETTAPGNLLHPHVGFFKGDVNRLLFMGAAVGLDYWFYKSIKRKKIDFVLQKIKKDPETFLKVIEDIHNDPEALENFTIKQASFTDRLSRLFDLRRLFKGRNPKIVALYKYVKDKHQYIRYNPLKSRNNDLISTNLAMLFGQEAMLKIHQIKNEQRNSVSLFGLGSDHDMQKYAIQRSAFEKDPKTGSYKPIGPEVSIITIIEYFFNTGSTMRMIRKNGGKRGLSHLRAIATFGNLIGYKQPKVITKILKSSWTPFVYRVMTHLFAVKFFDTACTTAWLEYLHKDSSTIRSLLKKYVAAKKINDQKKIKTIDKQLRDFIAKGHEKTSIFPWKNFFTWFSSRTTAINWQSTLLTAVVAAPVIYKILSSFFSLIQEHFEDEL